MANEKLVSLFKQGWQSWNTWREGVFKPNKSTLTGIELSLSNIKNTKPVKTRFIGFNFGLATLKLDAKWRLARLIRSEGGYRRNLRGADLSGTDLSGTNLSKANLSGANLSGANLRGIDLSSANLSGANLSSSDLTKAALIFANFNEADLKDADLSGAAIVGAIFTGAIVNRGTKFSLGVTALIAEVMQRALPAPKD
jgi:uncharacterized protein YjbI with pentapeptide repeats